jgi:hypothetical protein
MKVHVASSIGLLLAGQLTLVGIALWVGWGSWFDRENGLYDLPAANLVAGNGLSIARADFDDPTLTGLFHRAHPEKATSPFVPAVTFPPGYSLFLAGVYYVAGARNHLAAVMANVALLGGLLAIATGLARRAFADGPPFALALALMSPFPLWALCAVEIWSDTLHASLVALFALVWLRPSTSRRHVVLAGVVLALACLVRPYATLLPLAFLVGGRVFRCPAFAPRRVALLALVTWSLMGVWTLRNLYAFGKPILVSSMGLGYSLWLASYQFVEMRPAEMTPERMAPLVSAIGARDAHVIADNQRFLQAAIERIRERPLAYAIACVERMPRQWLFLLGPRPPLPVWLALKAYLLAAFVLMLAGGFLVRGADNPVLAVSAVIVTYYTIVFAPLAAEGRYAVPARIFGFLLAAAALHELLCRWRAWRSAFRAAS